MRLNRVLLLAATINILIFALVLTISCSGDNGPRGNAGKEGCSVKEDDKGNYSIFCTVDGEEEFAGTLYKNGIPGKKGNKGPKGDNCELGPLTTNGYEILCGTTGESKGYLTGCIIEIIDEYTSESTLTCGKNVINLCGVMPFDSKKYECVDANALSEITWEPGYCGVERKEYDPSKQYCGWAKGDLVDDLIATFAEQGIELDGTTIYDLCGKGEYALKPYENGWDDDIYCRYLNRRETKIAGEDPTDFCNGQKFNENSWKKQYCGFEKDKAERSLLSGACDIQEDDSGDTYGPHKIAYGQGFCEVKWTEESDYKSDYKGPTIDWNEQTRKFDTVSVYSEVLCGPSGKPNEYTWKGEYCGYASENSIDGNPTKVYAGLCDDGKGPHLEKFNDGYCTIDYDNRGSKKNFFTQEFCGDDPTLKPNDTEWKRQYCGVDENKNPVVYEGVCDDGQGPNQDEWNPKQYCEATYDKRLSTVRSENVCADGTKPNEGTFKYEYCGYDKKKADGGTETLRNNGCDDGDGPDMEDFGAGYCKVLYADKNSGKTTYAGPDEFCGKNTVNQGTWKNEYCGFSKKDADEPDKVYNDYCGDGSGGPYESGFPAEQYCEWVSEDSEATTLSDMGCNENEKAKKNEGKWKAQYCFEGDSRVATCPAGLIAVAKAKSTDPVETRCVTPIKLASCDKSLGLVVDNLGLGQKATNVSYFNQKCAYTVASGTTAAPSPIVPEGACPANKTNEDVKLYVDCAYIYTTYTASAGYDGPNPKKVNNPYIGSSACKKTPLSGKYLADKNDMGTYYANTNVYIASGGAGSGQALYQANASTRMQIMLPGKKLGDYFSTLVTHDDEKKYKSPVAVCVSRATYDECTNQGFVVREDRMKKVNNKNTITLDYSYEKASAGVAGLGRCEFTPKSNIAYKRKK